MSGTLRLKGSTSGYSELQAPAVAGDQTFILPATGGTLLTTASPAPTLTLESGTVTSPSLTFEGDSNTGIYSPAGDQLGITTGGSLRLIADNNGRVGIGTTSLDAQLKVQSPDSDSITSAFAVRQNNAADSAQATCIIEQDPLNSSSRIIANGTTNPSLKLGTASAVALTIDSSQEVGIGTTAPGSLLHTQGTRDYTGSTPSTSSYDINFQSGTAYVAIGQSNGCPAIQGHGSGTSYNLALVPNNGKVGIGNTDPDEILTVGNTTGNHIIRMRAGNTSVNGLDFGDSGDADIGRIRYSHSDNSLSFTTNASEKVRITSGGEVGIGTTSPDSKFEVVNSSASLVEVSRFRTEGNTNNPMLRILVDESEPKACIRSSGSAVSKLTFGAGNRDDLTIGTSGDVGINNLAPVAPLDVLTSNGRLLLREDGSDICIDSVNTANSAFDNLRIRGYNLTFEYGGAERMRIAGPSGNVGIGTSSPGSKFEVVDGGSTLYFRDNGTVSELLQKSEASGSCALYFGDTNDGVRGGFFYDCNSNYLSFRGYNNTERMRIDATGHIMIHQNSSSTPGLNNTTVGACFEKIGDGGALFLSRNGTASLFLNANVNTQVARFSRSGTAVGSITVTTTNTAYNTSSDYRLKENVIDLDGAIDRVKQLAPKRFNFIADADITVDGFLAHEAQTVVPEAVTGSKDEVDDDGKAVMQGIDQSKLVPLLTAALKEAIAKIETLEQRQQQLVDFEARLSALETAN